MNDYRLLLKSTAILEQFVRFNARPGFSGLKRLRKLQKEADKILEKTRELT